MSWRDIKSSNVSDEKKKLYQEHFSTNSSYSASGSSSDGIKSWRDITPEDNAKRISDRVNSLISNSTRFQNNYNSRFFDKSGNFNRSVYRGDGEQWLEAAKSQYSYYNSEADSILRDIDTYERVLGSEYVRKVKSALAQGKANTSKMLDVSLADKNYYSQFKNENAWRSAYNNDRFTEKYKGKSYDEVKKAIDSLTDEEEKSWLNENIGNYMTSAEAGKKADELNEQLKSARSNAAKAFLHVGDYDESTANSSTLNALRNERNKYEAIRDRNKEAEKIKAFEAVTKNSNFEGKSGFDSNSRNGQYQFINTGKLPYMRSEAVEQEENAYFGRGLDKLTDDEKKIYNYFKNTGDDEKAEEYLNALQVTLSERRSQTIDTDIKNALSEGNAAGRIAVGAIASAASVPMSVFGSVPAAIGDAVSAATGRYNPYSQASDAQRIAQSIRGGVSENIADNTNLVIGGENVLSQAYNGVMSSIDSVVGGATLGKLYAVTMGMGAASQQARELYERGASDRQILEAGILSGVAEYLGETLSLDHLLKAKSATSIGKMIYNFFIAQGFVEGSEEVATDIANFFIDEGILGENSERNNLVKQYMSEEGLTKAEAEKKAILDKIKETAWSGVSGAFSGMLSGGAFGVAEAVDTKKTGKAIKSNDNYNELKNAALQTAPDSESYKMAQKLNSKNKEPGNFKTGALYKATQEQQYKEAFKGKSAEEIKEELISSGESEQNAAAYAETISKVSRGEKVSRTALNSVLRNRNAYTAMRETISDTEAERKDKLSKVSETAELTQDKNAVFSDKVKAVKDSGGTFTGEEVRSTLQKNGMSEETANKAASAVLKYVSGEELSAEEKTLLTSDNAVMKSANELVTGKIRQINDARAPSSAKKSSEAYDNSDLGISTEGKFISQKSGNEIQIESISALDSKGNITFKTADGEELSGKDISFPNEGTAIVVNAISQTAATPQAATRMFNAFEGGKFPLNRAKLYARGIQWAFNDGFTRRSIKAPSQYDITEKQAKIAYNAGREAAAVRDRKRKNKVKRTTVTEIKEEITGSEGGKVTFANESDKENMTDTQKAAYDFSTELVRSGMGLDIVFYTSYKNAEGNYVYKNKNGEEVKAPNGMYSSAGKTIYVDLNSGDSGQGFALYTLSHELTHYIRDVSPDDFNKLADFLISEYGEEKFENLVDAMEETIRNNPEYAGLSDSEIYDLAYEDVVCQSMETMLSDTDAGKKILKLRYSEPRLFEKIKGWISDFVNKIKAAYKGMKPDSEAGRYFQKAIKDFEKIENLFAEAVNNAIESGRGESATEKFSFGGRLSKTADKTALQKAEEMEKQGKSSEEIRKSTGWFKSYDGMWRYEIDDSKMSLDDSKLTTRTDKWGDTYRTGKLSDIVKNPALFKAYPQLSDYTVIVQQVTPGTLASTWAKNKQIVVSQELFKRETRDYKRYTAEKQREIDRIESTPEYREYGKFFDTDYLDNDPVEWIKQSKKAQEKFFNSELGKKYHELKWGKSTVTKYEAGWDNYARKVLMHEIQHAIQHIEGFAKGANNKSRSYNSTAGEIESRDVEKRLDYSPEERKNTRPDIDRTDVVFNEDPDIRFSSRNTLSEASLLNDEMEEREKKRLSADVTRLNSLNQLIAKAARYGKIRESSLQSAASGVMKDAGVRRGKEDIVNILRKVYERMLGNRNLTAGQVSELCRNAADEILGKQSYKAERPEEIDNALKAIRKQPVSLNSTQRQELKYKYNSAYTKALFGKLNVTKNGTPLEEAWQSWAEEFPGVFEKDLNEAQMPERIIEIYNTYDTSGLNDLINEQREALATSIYDRYWNLVTIENYADDVQEEINGLKNKHISEMKKLRDEQDERIKKVKEAAKKQRERAVQVERDKQGERIKKVRDEYQKQRKDASERHSKSQLRQMLLRQLDRIDSKLKKTKKDNVKEELKPLMQQCRNSLFAFLNEDISDDSLIMMYDNISFASEKEDKWLTEYQMKLNLRDKYLENIENLKQSEREDRQEKINDNYHMIDLIDNRLRTLRKNLDSVITRLRRSHNAEEIQGAFRKLADEYAKIKNSKEAYVSRAYDEGIYNKLNSMATDESLSGVKVKDMTSAQARELYDAITEVITTVSNSNEFFAEDIKKDIDTAAAETRMEIGKGKGRTAKIIDSIKKFGWSNFKPIYAFRAIGSDTLTRLYENVRAGEDTWIRNFNKAEDFIHEQKKKYSFKEWDFKKPYEFTGRNGNKCNLTLEQVMSLYAYSLREQAQEHLNVGGFIFKNGIKEEKKKGITVKYVIEDKTTYNLGLEEMTEIANMLKEEQREYVKAMLKYLSSDMAELGNDVSIKIYGVRLFREKVYFPIKTSNYFLHFNAEDNGKAEIQLKNNGMTKETTPNANNPIVLDDFSNVWASHVNTMCCYNAFVLPLEDFKKVYGAYNVNEGNSNSVRGTIETKYGSAAVNYIETLIRDINGGNIAGGMNELSGKMLSRMKKGAVFASASVTIQQPSAIARAMAYINPKYFINAQSLNFAKHNREWEELKKYAPVAAIKEFGFFDTDLGQSAVEKLKSEEYDTLKEKAFALVKDGNYRDEALSWTAGMADEITWVSIWEACKKEAQAKGLKDEAMLQSAGKKFTEVIELTQVYDSVFSRSQLMRSKDGLNKIVTSFMAEPTTQINMLVDGVVQSKRLGKKQGAKFGARIGSSLIANVLLNSILKALVTMGRDKDEDKTLLEKYIGKFSDDFFENLNPLNNIPIARDIMTLVQGYDVERADISVISAVIEAIQQLDDDNKRTSEKIQKLVGAVGNLTGVPIANVWRDVRGAINIVSTVKRNGILTSPGKAAEAFVDGMHSDKKDGEQSRVFKALLSGNEDRINKVKAGYETEREFASAATAAISARYRDGIIKPEQARSFYMQYGGLSKEEADNKLRYYDFKKENKVDLSEKQVIKYLDEVSQAGISLETYVEFTKKKANCEGRDDDGDGKTDSGTLRESILKMIDSLKLTPRQKDVLYYQSNYKESTINEAPWH